MATYGLDGMEGPTKRPNGLMGLLRQYWKTVFGLLILVIAVIGWLMFRPASESEEEKVAEKKPPVTAPNSVGPAKPATKENPFPNSPFKPEQPKERTAEVVPQQEPPQALFPPPPEEEPPQAADTKSPAPKQELAQAPTAKAPAKTEAKPKAAAEQPAKVAPPAVAGKADEGSQPSPCSPGCVAERKEGKKSPPAAAQPSKPATAQGSVAQKDRFYAWIPPDATSFNRKRCYVDRPVAIVPERCSSVRVVAKRGGESIGAWAQRATAGSS